MKYPRPRIAIHRQRGGERRGIGRHGADDASVAKIVVELEQARAIEAELPGGAQERLRKRAVELRDRAGGQRGGDLGHELLHLQVPRERGLGARALPALDEKCHHEGRLQDDKCDERPDVPGIPLPERQLARSRLGVHVALRDLEAMDHAQSFVLPLLVLGQIVPGRVGVGEMRTAAGGRQLLRVQRRGQIGHVIAGAVDMPEERALDVFGPRIDLGVDGDLENAALALRLNLADRVREGKLLLVGHERAAHDQDTAPLEQFADFRTVLARSERRRVGLELGADAGGEIDCL